MSLSGPSWFVSLRSHLDPTGGGVQLCTQEFLHVLSEAGFPLVPKPYVTDASLTARLRRRLSRRALRHHIPRAYVADLLESARQETPPCVFFNQVDAAVMARDLLPLRDRGSKLILLSHGAKIVDELFMARERLEQKADAGFRTRWQLGDILVQEADLRMHLDHVFCLSEVERTFERWLGTKSVSWLPRTVSTGALDWKPVPGRLGFVGTLDHPPNRRDLRAVLQGCRDGGNRGDLRIRLVGGPAAEGRRIASEFTFVEYLGALSDRELNTEAATWCCFLHPLFELSRGASTKLAVALGWGIPILTTPLGCRGYIWTEGGVDLVDSSAKFAARAMELANPDFSASLRGDVLRAAKSTPSLGSIAAQVRRDIDHCGVAKR